MPTLGRLDPTQQANWRSPTQNTQKRTREQPKTHRKKRPFLEHFKIYMLLYFYNKIYNFIMNPN